MAIVERERISAKIVMYALYFILPLPPPGVGLSFRNTSRALQPFVERSHVAAWEWLKLDIFMQKLEKHRVFYMFMASTHQCQCIAVQHREEYKFRKQVCC